MPRLDTGEELDVLKAGQLGSLSRADGYRGVLKHSPTNQPLRSWMQDMVKKYTKREQPSIFFSDVALLKTLLIMVRLVVVDSSGRM